MTAVITYPVCGERKQKKLTIMVYMCGSNLETLRGAASSDIQEMIDSAINGNEPSDQISSDDDLTGNIAVTYN